MLASKSAKDYIRYCRDRLGSLTKRLSHDGHNDQVSMKSVLNDLQTAIGTNSCTSYILEVIFDPELDVGKFERSLKI